MVRGGGGEGGDEGGGQGLGEDISEETGGDGETRHKGEDGRAAEGGGISKSRMSESIFFGRREGKVDFSAIESICFLSETVSSVDAGGESGIITDRG